MDSNIDQSKTSEDLAYQVMPKSNGPLTQPEPTPVPAAAAPVIPAAAPAPRNSPVSGPAASMSPAPVNRNSDIIDDGMLPSEPEHRFGGKWLYIIISIVVLLGLGIAAYLLLGSKGNNSDDKAATASTLPKVWLSKNFGAETCADASRCGDAADPDNDGLTNIDEFHASTNPVLADTDSDGLADGDELHIYKTEPTLRYTDKREAAMKNDYNDGSQIANDYDPLTPNIKMTASRKDQISKDTATYSLHEPTKTTLSRLRSGNSSAAVNPQSYSIQIQATAFNPATISINKGDTIVWLNDDVMKHRIMSDPHPGHSALADLASQELQKNGTYTYRFGTTGTFKYHDEMNPALKGTIEVK